MRAPDALHFATALRVRPVFEDLHMVSGDKDIAEACRAYPLQHIDPEQADALAYLQALR